MAYTYVNIKTDTIDNQKVPTKETFEAVDATVVHKTGDETISGKKFFQELVYFGPNNDVFINPYGTVHCALLVTTTAPHSTGNFCTLDTYGQICYRKPAEVLTDINGQAKITVSGIVKGDGSGNMSAAVAGVDFAKFTVVDL